METLFNRGKRREAELKGEYASQIKRSEQDRSILVAQVQELEERTSVLGRGLKEAEEYFIQLQLSVCENGAEVIKGSFKEMTRNITVHVNDRYQKLHDMLNQCDTLISGLQRLNSEIRDQNEGLTVTNENLANQVRFLEDKLSTAEEGFGLVKFDKEELEKKNKELLTKEKEATGKLASFKDLQKKYQMSLDQNKDFEVKLSESAFQVQKLEKRVKQLEIENRKFEAKGTSLNNSSNKENVVEVKIDSPIQLENDALDEDNKDIIEEERVIDDLHSKNFELEASIQGVKDAPVENTQKKEESVDNKNVGQKKRVVEKTVDELKETIVVRKRDVEWINDKNKERFSKIHDKLLASSDKFSPKTYYVLRALGESGKSIIKELQSVLLSSFGVNVQVPEFSELIREMSMIGFIKVASVPGALAKYNLIYLSEEGALTFEYLFDKKPIVPEVVVLKKEHDNIEHGLFIKECFGLLGDLGYIDVSMDRWKNTIKIQQRQWIPDIIAISPSGKKVYVEVEHANHVQNEMEDKINKASYITKELVFVVKDLEALKKIREQISRWYFSERANGSDPDRIQFFVCSIRTLQAQKGFGNIFIPEAPVKKEN